MAYDPGHDFFVRFAASTAVISNSTGLVSGAPLIGGATTYDIGYTAPSGVVINDNTRIGYAAGRRGGSYVARGWREVSITIPIRIGSGTFISTYCLPAGLPPSIDIFYGISGRWSRVIYQARCSRISLNVPMSEGSEITANVTFEGIAYADTTAITLGYTYEQFGPALLATDVRSLMIGSLDVRQNMMSLSVDVDYQLERKNGRSNYGHNVVGSRTAYEFLPHHKVVSGSLTLHDLPTIESGLFYGGALSMDWSNMVTTINDVAATKSFNITVVNPRPVSRQQAEIESSAQMNFSIPIVADDLTVVATG